MLASIRRIDFLGTRFAHAPFVDDGIDQEDEGDDGESQRNGAGDDRKVRAVGRLETRAELGFHDAGQYVADDEGAQWIPGSVEKEADYAEADDDPDIEDAIAEGIGPDDAENENDGDEVGSVDVDDASQVLGRGYHDAEHENVGDDVATHQGPNQIGVCSEKQGTGLYTVHDHRS